MPPNPRLSKSAYLRGLQCPKSLWLQRFRPELAPAPGEAQRLLFEQGHELGRLARLRYPGGRLIEEDPRQAQEALAATLQAAAGGAPALYEPTAVHEGVLVRADILVRGSGGRDWDLVEVKGSTELKDVYIQDAAVQRWVLEGAGYPLMRTAILHVNSDYVRQGELDPKKLFTLHDVTAKVLEVLPEVPARVRALQEVLLAPEAPFADIGERCFKPYPCEFTGHCWSGVPPYSVFDLSRVSGKALAELRRRGVMLIRDIPDDFKLSPTQLRQVTAEKTGKPHIEPDAIADWLGELSYPLYFLDFETFSLAVPPYDGLRPFEQVPFQASVHVRERPGSEPRHLEHLAPADADPREAMAEFLGKAIGPKGSVVAYNASFEGSVLGRLAEASPKYANHLKSLKRRLWDLALPFRDGHYVHPGFRGSWSIKAVLPVLAPEMSYEGLAIGNGADAQTAYLRMMKGELTGAEAERTRAALIEYCGQDTLAMVRLLDVLAGR